MLRQKTLKLKTLLLQDLPYFPKIKGALFKNPRFFSDATFEICFLGKEKHFEQDNQFFFSSIKAKDQRSSKENPFSVTTNVHALSQIPWNSPSFALSF